MSKEDIHLNDINRILFGTAPATFLIEVFVRALIIYFFCLVFIKVLGKRMSGQISITEMAIMLLIGAIISVPVQFAERGLLQGLLLLVGTLLLYNGANWWGFKRKKVETILQGTTTMLVKDRVLQLDAMNQAKISRQQLFAVLRSKDQQNLGKIKRVYLEACGLFSIYEEEEEKPGLVTFPLEELDVIAATMEHVKNHWSCISCGYTLKQITKPDTCRHCHHHKFIYALRSREHGS